tara:strand:- start:182 stop:772 length:591 start_codon:yes stop_codon:yes gene_type:complete
MIKVKHAEGGTILTHEQPSQFFVACLNTQISEVFALPMASADKTLLFKRSQFATRLPLDCVYNPSHFWARQGDNGVWRVGFTKFATRMLGDMVDHDFEAKPGTTIEPGQILGWVEGFKAISDVYSFCSGEFVGCNSALQEKISLIHKSPYEKGWLYEMTGKPDDKCVDAEGYAAILNQTIDKMLEQQQAQENEANE